MEQKLKELLIKELCPRLPYSLKVKRPDCGYYDYVSAIDIDAGTLTCQYNGYTDDMEKFKPYLRPMSSMTEEEEFEYYSLGIQPRVYDVNFLSVDWLNAHHFDYRDLIEKGLALEAPDGMYDLKKK